MISRAISLQAGWSSWSKLRGESWSAIGMLRRRRWSRQRTSCRLRSNAILEKGQLISKAIVVISGELEAIINGSARMTLRPGQLIGDVSAYSGLASPADVVARGPVTLAKWDLGQVREFTASGPELRANLLRMVSVDLAVKLLDIANAGHDLVAEKLVQD
jgi:CRP-like cAMP-binding protein